MTFADLGLGRVLLEALRDDGIDVPFPVQLATIGDVLRGRDVAVQAPTGSGKTLAFGLPLLERTRPSTSGAPHALVLAPTRELARQIGDVLSPLAQLLGLRVVVIHGGVAFEPQIDDCAQGIDVVVACPGRLLDLIERGHLALGEAEIVVIDEADRMADMGFLPDVCGLLGMTAHRRQTLLYSATLDGDVEVLVRDHQRDPVRYVVVPDDPWAIGALEPGMPPPPPAQAVRHHLWSVPDDERAELTADIVVRCGATMVFVRTRHGAERLAVRLAELRVDALALHGGNSQLRRDQALDDFRAGRVQALVATDVAARGVHVDDVACVVQYDLPVDPKDYVHRAGRTGRAGASGAVVTLVTPSTHERAMATIEIAGLTAEVAIEPPDLTALESSAQRRRIDRELAAMASVRRPGAVGTVSFARPQIVRDVSREISP